MKNTNYFAIVHEQTITVGSHISVHIGRLNLSDKTACLKKPEEF